MAFKDYLTVEGERLLALAAAGTKITFTKMVMGSGIMADSMLEKNMTSVITPVIELPLSSVTVNGTNTVLLQCYYDNSNVSQGFYFREKGIYATDGENEVLAIYGNSKNTAEFVDTPDVVVIEKKIKTILMLTSDEIKNINISNETNAAAPILRDMVLEDFVISEAAQSLEIGQFVILKKIPYMYLGDDPEDPDNYVTINDMYDHFKDEKNPHKVTAEQVGLGNVPNVATNDQIPTYTEAGTLATLTSGEKLSIAFGKIKCAITRLIDHLADKAMHITANERASWNAKASTDVVSTSANGLCPKRGGTTTKFLRDDGTWAVPPNTTYGTATTSAAGLMSAAMVTKLNGIATGATKNTVDSALSSTSTNPVQNKVVNAALEEINSNLGKVLWTNPSPTSTFAQQTVTLSDDVSNYKYIAVIFKTIKNSTYYMSSGLIPAGLGISFSQAYAWVTKREISFSNNTATISNTVVYSYENATTTTSTDNNYAIPYKIIGYF